MKAIFLNRKTAAVVLIVIAVMAVPLLGGLKLKAAYGSAFNAFESEGKRVDKYGNSLISDMDACIDAAEDVLAIARPLIGADNESVLAAESADASYRSADTVRARYEAFQLVTSKIRLVYELTADRTDDTSLRTLYSTVLDRSAIIARGYEDTYRSAADRASSLISGFPASVLARLFGIG